MQAKFTEWKQVCEDTEATAPKKAVVTFPESLGKRMDDFDESVAPVAKDSSPMSDEEAADNQAANTRATKMTQDYLDQAVAAGEQNQVVKKKLIQWKIDFINLKSKWDY